MPAAYHSSCEDQELVGHLAIELSFLLCKFLYYEGCSLEFLPIRVMILEVRLAVLSGYTAFLNNQKMVSILYKELECEYCMYIIGTEIMH